MEIHLDGKIYNANMNEDMKQFGFCSFDFSVLEIVTKRKWFGLGESYEKRTWKKLYPQSSAMIDPAEFNDIRCSPSIVTKLITKALKHVIEQNNANLSRWQNVEQVYNIVNNDEPA